MSRSFSTSLCGCFDDCGICCCGLLCTPCLYGDNVGKLDGGGCCGSCCAYTLLTGIGLGCLVAGPTRHKIRTVHGLKEEPCSDCCTHCWCSPCAVCQEAREIKAKGTQPTVIASPPAVQVMAAPTKPIMG